MQVALSVTNQGAADVSAGATVTVYALEDAGPREISVVTLPEVLAGQQLDGILVELTPADIGPRGFEAVIDASDVVNECDEDNNTADWSDTFCP